MTELENCFEKGQLVKKAGDLKKATASLKISREHIGDAKVHQDNKLYNWALIAAYTSMFHAARALLFRDGIKERSHFCLCVYVKENYKGQIELKYLNELDILREQRHRILYGDRDIETKEIQEEEADSAIKMADGFLESVKKIIG